MKKSLIQGMAVQVHQDGEKIDEGLVLSVSVWEKNSVPKIEYKSTFLRIEGIIDFVSLTRDDKYQFLFKNPINPAQKICYQCAPEYIITPLE